MKDFKRSLLLFASNVLWKLRLFSASVSCYVAATSHDEKSEKLIVIDVTQCKDLSEVAVPEQYYDIN